MKEVPEGAFGGS